jgi:uncharacterized membrane protein
VSATLQEQPAAEDGGAEDAVALTHPISKQLHEKRSGGERLADGVAAQIGSWRFLIIQTIAVGIWVALNLLAVAHHWDPYPFVLLNLLFSVQAAYTGPVLLLSQNRSAQRDRIMAEHDYATNEKSEQLIEALLSEVLRNSQATLAIAEHLGIELESLTAHGLDLEAKIDTVQEQLGEVEDVVLEQVEQTVAVLDAVASELPTRNGVGDTPT